MFLQARTREMAATAHVEGAEHYDKFHDPTAHAENGVLRAWFAAGPKHVTGSDVPDSLAEAEEEVARAEARAEAARTRAARLRQDVDASSDRSTDAADEAEDGDGVKAPGRVPRRWPVRVHRPGRTAVAVGVGAVLVCAALGVSGYMLWQDRVIERNQQLAQEFTAAARVGVTAFMSIDPKHAKQDIQRSIDASTGDFKTQLEARSGFMAQRAEESKVISKVSIEAVGIESMTHSSGIALVSAKSDVTDPDNSKRPPMLWRMSVKIERDAGGQLKMSGLDFVP